jgi:hypothetical protein
MFGLFVGYAASAEPITATEAEAALRSAQKAANTVGSYRQESVRQTKTTTTTTTILTQRAAKGPKFTRTESVTITPGHPERTIHRLSLTNAEGKWQVYGTRAVLMPNPLNLSGTLETLRAAIRAKDDNDPALRDITDPKTLATVKKAKELAAHVHLNGERVTEEGRAVVRVSRSYDPEVIDFMRPYVDEVLTAMKKQLSFGKRMLVNVYLASQGGVDGLLPRREVFVIDVEKNRIIATETYNAKGKQLRKVSSGKEPERIADLPPETFALPANAEIFRPQTLAEAMELTQKLEEDERRIAAWDS